MKNRILGIAAQLTAAFAFCGAVDAAQIITPIQISEDFEANIPGNNAIGWNYNMSASSSGLIQNDGDAHGNYLAIRLVSPVGAKTVSICTRGTRSHNPRLRPRAGPWTAI